MGLLTLMSAVLLTAQTGDVPRQVMISAKCYEMSGKLAIYGKGQGHQYEDFGTFCFEKGVSEREALAKNKLKLITAPTVRTLSGQQAEISIQFGSKVETSEKFTLRFLPKIETESLIKLDVQASKELVAVPEKSVSAVANLNVVPESVNFLFVNKLSPKLLIVIKAWLPTDQK